MQPAETDASRYATSIDPESDTTRAKVVRLVGEQKRVLELGCATGHMSRALVARGCTVVGVEIDPRAAESARAFCERVIVGDLEGLDLGHELDGEEFDVVVAGDVLEHLRDPGLLLRRLKQWIGADGYLVASIPNVAHASIRLSLLRGRFRYTSVGLLDRTHLRFFTRESIERLLEDAGYRVRHLEGHEKAIEESEAWDEDLDVPAGLREALERDPEARTYQYILVARPRPEEGEGWLPERARRLSAERDRALRELDELRGRLGDLAELEDRVRIVTGERDEARREIRALWEMLEKRAGLETRLREVEAERDRALDEIAALKRSRDERADEARLLEARVEQLRRREKELREMLLDAHDQLLRRDHEIEAEFAASRGDRSDPPSKRPTKREPDGTGGASRADRAAKEPPDYESLVSRVREVVGAVVPDDATVIVVSRGDEELLELGARTAWHFPQNERGVYAGHYPENGREAVRHLESLRKKGGGFLLFPGTAVWWLEHYPHLRKHLGNHYRPMVHREDLCVIYDLRRPRRADRSAPRRRGADARRGREDRKIAVARRGSDERSGPDGESSTEGAAAASQEARPPSGRNGAPADSGAVKTAGRSPDGNFVRRTLARVMERLVPERDS